MEVEFSKDKTQGSLLGNNAPPSLFGVSYRIALVGEAYGKDEAVQGQPFVGLSGRFLNALLAKASIVRNACYIGNVCPIQPTGNNLATLNWGGPEIQGGIAKLTDEMVAFRPNLVVCLGNTALHLFKEGNTPPSLRYVKATPSFSFLNSVDSWRGSLFSAHPNSPIPSVKCIASYHPAACLRQYSWTPLLLFDLRRARKEGETAELVLPKRGLVIDYPLSKIATHVNAIRRERLPISCDIEGGLNSLSCISIATDANFSFVVPFRRADGSNYWATVEEELTAWVLVSQLMSDPNVPKIFQNGLYDCFVLQYGYNIPVLNVVEDTMLKFWEKYCELEKSLGFQCSILTDEPYYKFERKSKDTNTLYRYCCKDSAVTFELSDKLTHLLTESQLSHYRFNVSLLRPLLYMELRGIRYAGDLAKQRLAEVNYAVYEWQQKLDNIAGLGIHIDADKATLLEEARDLCCYKRDRSQPKKEYASAWAKITRLLTKDTSLTNADIGYLNTALNKGLNIKSTRFKTYLYETLALPPQYDPKTKTLTTDYEALLKLSKKTKHPAVETAIELGSLRTRAQMLAISADRDNRVRCGYNLVGTETGRITCYTSPTGSGYNLQTIPGEDLLKPAGHPLHYGMRDLFLPDDGRYFFQCDLSGADGWTVGAHLFALGHPTMLADLRAKLKPAAVICYLLRHGNQSLSGKEREEVKEMLKEVKKEDWDYFACKQGIWGTCYLMGPDKLADVILIQSEGKVSLSRSQVRDFQTAVFSRYNVRVWHQATAQKLERKPELISASGQIRRFFGRREEILGEALANEPQQNTTYATNLAMYKLWNDPENRRPVDGTNLEPCTLRIEPLHQVHDALCGQFRKEDTAWAVSKIKSYFANTIKIAGLDITIPFEGAYGTSWGNLNIGTI